MLGCASTDEVEGARKHPVDGVRKVVDSLVAEIVQRSGTEGFRGLPIVVVTTATASGGLEPLMAEFLRTRLVERGMAVHVECAGRCMEVKLQEFSMDAPKAGVTPGQVFTVVGGTIPILGGAIRTLGEHERESRRAAARTTGLLVILAAREGNRYGARVNVVGIVSSGGSEVALEQK
jgi:hypothetical protein